MSGKQPKDQQPDLTRRQIFSVGVKASIPLISMLGFSSAQADDRWDRWWRHDYRRSFRNRLKNRDDKSAHYCFLRGTKILTAKGEIRIEEVSIGDLLKTWHGDWLPVKWIGRQRFDSSGSSGWQKSVMPVRISRFAIDGLAPHRDLYVSPGHALFLDDILIPASFLVNGRSIVQALPEGTRAIEYFHIELQSHQAIFAEGVAAETLLVKADREAFDNFIEYERLYGTEKRPKMKPFAPIASYNGGRSEFNALLRRAASPIVDIRDPIQVAYDRIASRSFYYA
jgi:hypothetical protein